MTQLFKTLNTRTILYMTQLFKTLNTRTISQYFTCYFINIITVGLSMRDKNP